MTEPIDLLGEKLVAGDQTDRPSETVLDAPETIADAATPRPKRVACAVCSRPIRVGPRGPLPSRCGQCSPRSRAQRRRRAEELAAESGQPSTVGASSTVVTLPVVGEKQPPPGAATFAATLGAINDPLAVGKLLGVDPALAGEALASWGSLASGSATGRQQLLGAVVTMLAARLVETTARMPASQIPGALRAAVDALEKTSGGMISPVFQPITIDFSEKG